MLSRLAAWRRFLRTRRAVAALEFALIVGPMVTLLLGTYDISEAVIFYQETYNAAHSISASVSNLAVNPSTGATSLTYTQIQQAASEIWGQVPSVRSGSQNGTKSVTISSVVFEPTFTSATCTNGTTNNPCYVPVVVWSVAYAGGHGQSAGQSFTTSSSTTQHDVLFAPGVDGTGVRGISSTCATFTQPPMVTNAGTSGNSICLAYVVGTNTGNNQGMYANTPLRPCDSYANSPLSNIAGSLNQSLPSAGSPSDLTNLRTLNLTVGGGNVAPPAPILVVDVHLQYQPIIGLIIGHSVDFWVNAYWPVRSVQVTATGTSTPLTLFQQFTTISESSVYTDSTGTAVVPVKNWCINEVLQGATVP